MDNTSLSTTSETTAPAPPEASIQIWDMFLAAMESPTVEGETAGTTLAAEPDNTRLRMHQFFSNMAHVLEPDSASEQISRLQDVPPQLHEGLQSVIAEFQRNRVLSIEDATESPTNTPDNLNQQPPVPTPPGPGDNEGTHTRISDELPDMMAADSGAANTTRQGRARRSPNRTRHKRKILSAEEKMTAFALQFGEFWREKPDGVTRCCFGNIGPGGVQPYDDSRRECIRMFLNYWQIDHFGSCEIQVNWKNIPYDKRPAELYRSDTALRCITAHNTNDLDNHSPRQQGGTMAMSMGEMAMRMHSQGIDPTGLGRWVWQLFKGKDGIVTRIYTAYRPCFSNATALNTVYTQHKRYFRSHRKPGEQVREPRAAFLEDLELDVQARKMAGERIILMMDANGDVTSGPIKRFALSTGLRDTILSHNPTQLPQATFRNGSDTIDIVLASPELTILSAAFLSGDDSLGDHKMAMVDFVDTTVIGENLMRIVRPQARRLACGIPSSKRRYTSYLLDFCQQHKLLQKLHVVQAARHSNAPLELELAKMMTDIDRIREEGMVAAEKKCRKLCMGLVDFSPTMQRAGRRVELCSLIRRKKLGHRVGSNKIRRLAKQLDVRKPLSVTLEEAESNYKDALEEYATYKPNAAVFRYQYLVASKDDPEKSEEDRLAIDRLLNKERARQSSRDLRRIKNKPHLGAISKVEVPGGLGQPTITHETQATVEKAIMDSIAERYRLSSQSPFLLEPLRSLVGLTGTSLAAQQILAGTFQCPAGVDEATQLFIKLLKRPSRGIHCVDTTIIRDDWQWYWKKATESTSSAHSGLHFGHWKASAYCDYLSELHSLFTEIATSSGYSPPRWSHALIVMLEKKPGVILVDKLRAINLLEGDFNFSTKLFLGLRMMKNAEKHRLTVPEALGSRKHHDAKELAHSRRLQADISRQQVRPFAVASVDAAQCYDSIAHPPASLACQRLGAPPLFLSCMLLTIQLMKFHLRTAYGDSDNYFGGPTHGDPLQGILQGNGGGPSFWYAVSVVLVIMLYHKGHGAKYRSALSGELTTVAGLLFVDDTDLLAYGESLTSAPAEVVEALQATVLTWQQGLSVTGGSLKLDKCSWSLLAYHFKQGRPQIHTPRSYPAKIFILTPAGNQVEIKRVPASEGITVVGVVQALNGKMKPQVDALQEKAELWAKNVKEGWMNRRLAWTCLQTMIWPSLAYPLLSCSMTKTQGDAIITPLYQAMLPELGLQKKFPRIWRYAPRMYQALSLYHPYIEQGIEQVSVFQKAGLSDEINGGLQRTTTEQAQLEIGTSKPLLQEDFSKWGHLLTDNLWIGSLWQFCSDFDITLEDDHFQAPARQRENDAYLMELLAERFPFTGTAGNRKEAWRSLNRCRLSLQVLLLSDITTGDGNEIRQDYLSARATVPRPQSSKWEWPLQKPTKNDWERWQHAMKLLSSPTGRLAHNDRLGAWIAESHQPQPWRFDPVSKCLFQLTDVTDAWKVYHPSQSHTRRSLFELSAVCHTQFVPDTVQLPMVLQTLFPNKVEMRGYAPLLLNHTPTILSIPEVIQSLGLAAWPLQKVEWAHASSLARAFQDGTAIGVADGSYMKERSMEHGTTAWLLQPEPDSKKYLWGRCFTSGTPREVNAYRSELQGVHALLLTIWVICKAFNVQSGSITLACDNDTTVNHTNDTRLDVPTSVHHADLVRAIRRIRRDLPITVHMQYVSGHADKHTPFNELSPHEKLNVLADYDAKELLRIVLKRLHTPRQFPPVPDYIYGEGIRCIVGGIKVTGNPKNALKDHMFRDSIAKELDKKGTLPYTAFSLVNWTAMDQALSARSPSFCAWVTKHVTGQCGVGHRMKEWGYWETDNCPCCQKPNETTTHFPFCENLEMMEAYNKMVGDFSSWMKDTDTDPCIAAFFTTTLRRRQFPGTDYPLPNDMLPAQQDQLNIGWNNILFGRLATKWMILQKQHLTAKRSKKSPERWAADMTYRLLQISHGLWMKRNGILHERDLQGLLLADGKTLTEAITGKFTMGKQALLPIDHHLLDRRLPVILAMPASDKYTWLGAIQLAHKLKQEEAQCPMARMRQSLATWLESANDRTTSTADDAENNEEDDEAPLAAVN